MKVLFLILITASILSCKKRPKYSFPIGEDKHDVRKEIKKLPVIKFGKVVYGDTIDWYSVNGQHTEYYYKNDICYRETQTFPLGYENVIRQSFDKYYKKIRSNIWVDSMNSRITLKEDKKQNIFSYDVVSNKINSN